MDQTYLSYIVTEAFLVLFTVSILLTSLALACFFWFEMVDERLHPQRQLGKRRRFFDDINPVFDHTAGADFL